MKRKLRLAAIFILCILIIALLPLSVNATAPDITEISIEDTTYLGNGTGHNHVHDASAPEWEPVCGQYHTHDMRSNGWAYVYKGVYPNMSNHQFDGAQWQCTRCYLTMATTGDNIPNGAPIGSYGIATAIEPNTPFAFIWVSNVSYTSSSILEGYTFRWA